MVPTRRALATTWLTLSVGIVFGFLLVFTTPGWVSAHGEIAQEPFLREETVSFFDVQFSTTKLAQGDTLTITGKFMVLDTWPRELTQPGTAYLSVSVPGPVFVVTDRQIGGQEMPMSFYVEKGKVYDFKLVLQGRSPGTYHVHPALYSEGVGPLLGPGEWITITPVAGGFHFPIKLLNGQTIDLMTYKTPFILGFSIVAFILGMIWLLYWTVPKPTVTRLAITNLIPSADWGSDFGLITRRDVFNVGVIALVALALLAGGWVYNQVHYPVTLPPQVIRQSAPADPAPPQLIQVTAEQGTFDPSTYTLTLKSQIKNVSDTPVQLQQLTMANREFVLGSPSKSWQEPLVVNPADTTINPGETKELTFTITGRFLTDERLITLDQPIEAVGGVLVFQGKNNVVNYIPQRWGFVSTSLFK